MTISTINDPTIPLASEDAIPSGNSENAHLASKEVCLFLADYASTLLGSGATCIRIEKNINRMAEVFGKRVELTIMPRHVHLTVWNPKSDDRYTSTASVAPAPISFSLNTRLSELSWTVADSHLSLDEARERFLRIATSDKHDHYG